MLDQLAVAPVLGQGVVQGRLDLPLLHYLDVDRDLLVAGLSNHLAVLPRLVAALVYISRL